MPGVLVSHACLLAWCLLVKPSLTSREPYLECCFLSLHVPSWCGRFCSQQARSQRPMLVLRKLRRSTRLQHTGVSDVGMSEVPLSAPVSERGKPPPKRVGGLHTMTKQATKKRRCVPWFVLFGLCCYCLRLIVSKTKTKTKAKRQG